MLIIIEKGLGLGWNFLDQAIELTLGLAGLATENFLESCRGVLGLGTRESSAGDGSG